MMKKQEPDLERLFDDLTEDEAEDVGTEEENPFLEAAQALAEMEENDELPEGFDLEDAVQDYAFAKLLSEFEPQAAVRIYAAERRADEAEQNARAEMSETVRARGALPRPQRADRAIGASPDYMAMSDEAFRALEQQYKKAAHSGKRVQI